MPLYDYRCGTCGREVEVMHGIHDHGPAICEACGGTMSKVLSPPAIHFKGSGWAKKDAASASASRAKPQSSSTDSTPAKSDGTSPAEGKGKGADAGSPATSTSTATAGKGKD